MPLPDSLDLVTAASLGCRFATAYRALTAHGGVERGSRVVVHGCGGVGLSAVMIAAALGAEVVAVDVSEAALGLAGELGADHLVTGGTDAVDRVVARTAAAAERARAPGGGAAPPARGGAPTDGGADVSVDAFGSAATAVASVSCLRPRGRHVQVGLLLGDDATPPLPMGLVVAKELSVHGSHGMAARDYPAMLDLIASGALQPERLVRSVIGLDDAGAALAAMSRPATSAGVTVVRLEA